MSTKIGRFEIITELSKSASGAVYKANDPDGGRTVALKTIRLDLPPGLAQILIQLILHEAESTKVLNSQNIALLYGAGEIDAQFCASMEYVEGNSLANMITSQEGFSIWDLLDISRQVCLALDHADSHGVLHRSLEPAKIMMQWDGTVKVLGYGVSTMVSAMPRKGANVPPLFYYMSPEQVKGETMDIRSNIFSWGAMLYEMVTDRKPFAGHDVQSVRQKILEETPEPPATINPRMNLGVSRVIMQALAKSPEERYQQGQDVLLDLEKAKETTQAKAAKEASKAPSGLVIPDKLKEPSTGSSKFIVPSPPEVEDAFIPAVSPSTPPTPAKSGTGATANPAPSGVLNAAGEEVSTTRKKAAAAAAGTGGSKPASTAPSMAGKNGGTARAPEQMSAGAAPAPAVEPPKFRGDPMMAEPGSQAGKAVSFSDLEELPPLKEIFLAPKEAPAADPQPAQPPPVPPASLKLHQPKEERPRIVTRENAKKAVAEIKKVPPKLAIYSVAAAAAIILLVVLGISYHIYHQSPDDDAPPASAGQPTEQPKPPLVQETPALESDEPEVVVIKPRYAPKKAKATAPVRPSIIPGELSLNSTPEGAHVTIDGRSDPAWVTPYTLTGLNPGPHSIGISKPGFSGETRTIEVASGSKSFVVMHLAPLGATVAVATEPSGANVYIDGKDTGKVTPAQIVAEKGTHTFLVRKQGYLDETTTAELAPGQTFRYSPILKALGVTDEIKTGGKFKKFFSGESTAGMGKVTVKTQPKGAQITVNRRMVDKLAPVDFYLNPGNYMIDITLSGYKPIHRVINVERSNKVELNQNMEPQ